MTTQTEHADNLEETPATAVPSRLRTLPSGAFPVRRRPREGDDQHVGEVLRLSVPSSIRLSARLHG